MKKRTSAYRKYHDSKVTKNESDRYQHTYMEVPENANLVRAIWERGPVLAQLLYNSSAISKITNPIGNDRDYVVGKDDSSWDAIRRKGDKRSATFKP